MRDFNKFLEGRKYLKKWWLIKQGGESPRAEHMQKGMEERQTNCLMEPGEGLTLGSDRQDIVMA